GIKVATIGAIGRELERMEQTNSAAIANQWVIRKSGLHLHLQVLTRGCSILGKVFAFDDV
ncbi:hypothetical protein, partial [Klebsiella pneumoniae]|uniref:hypothetical protein n=1 Tax=Klebsiella pneumoniae TaxID=573 RepID=UPI003B9819E8